MSNMLAVLINGEVNIEYDRNIPLTEQQRSYLDVMDKEMDAGITLAGERVDSPDAMQRAQFVAIILIQSLMADEGPRIAATSSYLAERLEELKQVKAAVADEDIDIELVFDQEYQNQVRVSFATPSSNEFH